MGKLLRHQTPNKLLDRVIRARRRPPQNSPKRPVRAVAGDDGDGGGGGGEGGDGGGDGATQVLLIVSHELAGPSARVFRLKRSCAENIFVCAVVAAGPVHEEMSWLNAEADSNIYPILVTFSVSQLPISWLKEKD